MPKIAGNQKSQEETGRSTPLKTSEEAWPCQHLDFRALSPELYENKFLFFQSVQVFGNLFQQPQEINACFDKAYKHIFYQSRILIFSAGEINILTHIKLNHFCLTLMLQEKAEFISNLVGQYHRFNGDELGQTPGEGDGQGGLVCCSPWGHKELHTTF